MKDQKYIEHLVFRLSWQDIDCEDIRKIISLAIAEDIGGFGLKKKPSYVGDITTDTLSKDSRAKANLVARKDLYLCGENLVALVLDEYSKAFPQDGSCTFTPAKKDGEFLAKGDIIGTIEGSAKIMLRAERILLNFLQHLSGIATYTNKFVKAMGNSKTMLLDTRKTIPTHRVLEKFAVACGGAFNHRIGLFDRVMLKDNHLAFSASTKGERLALAVEKSISQNPDIAVEVEVDSISQIEYVLQAKADVIMFDNFSVEEIKQAVQLVGDKAWTEISGGVSLDSVAQLATLGCDFISCGALVHQSTWIDIGLDSV
ncbi:MAG: carboxylating nicotinate-nucleotide diphosphorylase [Opitutales bacterium]